jgi:hypothetical protein
VNPIKFSGCGTRPTHATAGHSPPDRLVEAEAAGRAVQTVQAGYTLRIRHVACTVSCPAHGLVPAFLSTSLPVCITVVPYLDGRGGKVPAMG